MEHEGFHALTTPTLFFGSAVDFPHDNGHVVGAKLGHGNIFGGIHLACGLEEVLSSHFPVKCLLPAKNENPETVDTQQFRVWWD